MDLPNLSTTGRMWHKANYSSRVVGRVFANGLGDQGPIPGQVIPKAQKMVLDAALLNTLHYNVQIKGKVEQSSGRCSTLPYTSVWLLMKREPLSFLRLWLPTLFWFYNCFLSLDRLPYPSSRVQPALPFTDNWWENSWIHTCPKSINTM